MAFENQFGSRRQFHGDVVLQVEAISDDSRSITGVDLRSGEVMTVSLASPEELAAHWAGKNDNRTFDERLTREQARNRKRRDILDGGKVVEGSVVRLEDTRTINAGSENAKTMARWSLPLARDPEREMVVKADFDIGLQRNGRPVIRAYDTASASSLEGFDFEAAFNGDFAGVPANQSGVVITVRDENGKHITNNLLTAFRSDADPSIDSALKEGKGLNEYGVMAGAVVAASTGRPFEDLKIQSGTSDEAINNARAVFEDVSLGGNRFQIQVVPAATFQFLTNSESDFLKDFHGTADGVADPAAKPDPGKSWAGKGVAPGVLAVNYNPNDTAKEGTVSATKLFPTDGWQFRNQPEQRFFAVMEEVMSERLGSQSAGHDGPQQQRERNLAADPSPMG